MTIVAAADGSALGNPGPAGWAWYVDDDTWAAGGWPHGTNNQGELMAVIDLLDSTAHLDDDLRILCDSQYVINAVTKWIPGWKARGWRKADGKPVLNRELLERLDRATLGRRYRFEWVKGHAGHELNEAADARARAAATAYQNGTPIPIGPGWPGRAVETRQPEPADAPSAATVSPAPVLALFSDDDDAFGTPDDHEQVILLERELLSPAVRADSSRVAAILHADFEEIGSSGRLWNRDAIVNELAGQDSERVAFEVLGSELVAPDAILLTARTSDSRGSALRSSLWLRVDGRWRLRFHQGTPEA
ncbi:RNase H family protein [Diaminobutyricibacter sp. McL0618]|uniref:RNase H family protein n=1 Tax=Leifsonia sp. McL0618 TaxID=3415677 RepID=UPI003CF7129D